MPPEKTSCPSPRVGAIGHAIRPQDCSTIRPPKPSAIAISLSPRPSFCFVSHDLKNLFNMELEIGLSRAMNSETHFDQPRTKTPREDDRRPLPDKPIPTMQRIRKAVVPTSQHQKSMRVVRGPSILTLLVAAMAILSSKGCQLICKIFLLKSI